MKFWTKLILIALCVGYFSLNLKIKREAFDVYALNKGHNDFKQVFLNFHKAIGAFEKRLEKMETRLTKATNPKPKMMGGLDGGYILNEGHNDFIKRVEKLEAKTIHLEIKPDDWDDQLDGKWNGRLYGKSLADDVPSLKIVDKELARTIERNAEIFKNEDRKIMSAVSDLKKQIGALKTAIDQSAFDARSFQVKEINTLKDWTLRTFQIIGDTSDQTLVSLEKKLRQFSRNWWVDFLKPILDKMPKVQGIRKVKTVPGHRGAQGPMGMPGPMGPRGVDGFCVQDEVEKAVERVIRKRFGT